MIEVIETSYKGYRFRSRTEARWAVFFDALGIVWEYEMEGYKLGKEGWYLPDFWLPQYEIYIEVKYAEWDEEGFIKWLRTPKQDALEEQMTTTVITLCGTPGRITSPWDPKLPYEGFMRVDHKYFWCECPYCGALGIQFEARSARNKHNNGCEIPPTEHDDRIHSWNTSRLNDAYDMAKQERFERK